MYAITIGHYVVLYIGRWSRTVVWFKRCFLCGCVNDSVMKVKINQCLSVYFYLNEGKKRKHYLSRFHQWPSTKKFRIFVCFMHFVERFFNYGFSVYLLIFNRLLMAYCLVWLEFRKNKLNIENRHVHVLF